MTAPPNQGEIWWAEASDKRRPVLVVTRNEAIPVLTWIVVAPVTKTVRRIPTEVALGPAAAFSVFVIVVVVFVTGLLNILLQRMTAPSLRVGRIGA